MLVVIDTHTEPKANALADSEDIMTRTPNSAIQTFIAMQRDEHTYATQRARHNATPAPTALTIGAAANYLSWMNDHDVLSTTGVPAAAFRAAFTAAVSAHGRDADLDTLVGHYPTCHWLVRHGLNEDGEEVIRDCAADVTITDTGWSCDAGHEHVDMETRHAEGWDYANDPEEAALLRKYGTDAVDMRGGSI